MSELQKADTRIRRAERRPRLFDLAARLPGAGLAREAYEGIEHFALTELKNRLDAVSPAPPTPGDTTSRTLSQRTHPRVLLSALLDEATEQDREAAQRALYTAILLQLTSDEACMLAALSDGSEFALVNITVGTLRTGTRVAARNFCSIERGAPVKLRDYVPAYITHLHSLGLVDIASENRDLEMKYQILEASPRVSGLIRDLSQNNRNVKTQRRTLRIAPLGRDLWSYCDPARAESDD